MWCCGTRSIYILGVKVGCCGLTPLFPLHFPFSLSLSFFSLSFLFLLIFQWTKYISDECAVKLTVCFHAGKVSWLQQLLAILPHSIHHFVKVLMFCSEPPRKERRGKEWQNRQNLSFHAKKLNEIYPCLPLEQLMWHFPECHTKIDCQLLKCMFKLAVMQL